MVHVGVARHIHEVKLLDAAIFEVLRGRGQELAAVGQRRGGGLLGLLCGLGGAAGRLGAALGLARVASGLLRGPRGTARFGACLAGILPALAQGRLVVAGTRAVPV